MYASTPTKLPLATFARYTGLHPLHMAQVFYYSPSLSDRLRSDIDCGRVLPQYEWQDSDAVSREEIARSIAEAEEMIEGHLGYRLIPAWEVDEWQQTSRFWRPELTALGRPSDLRGYPQSVKAKWAQPISGGIRGLTLLADAVAITYSDNDSDGYKERAQVTVNGITSEVAACEIRIFYPGKAGKAEWEIRPVEVSLVAGNATIRFRREQCVLEELQERLVIEEVDGSVDANFLTTVDVYRVFNDPSTMASLLWNISDGICGCNEAGCSLCQYETQTACLNIRGTRAVGLLSYEAAEWDAANLVYSAVCPTNQRTPDIVRLWYYAGLRDERLDCPSVQMNQQWGVTVARLALALMDRPPCGCVGELWDRWQRDLAATGGADELETYNLSASDLGNPLGTKAGMVNAWRRIKAAGRFGEVAPLVAFVP